MRRLDLRSGALFFVGAALLAFTPHARAAEPKPYKMVTTPSGVSFGIIGDKGNAPAPTLFLFAHDVHNTLGNRDYNRLALLVAKRGFLCVALDVPGHGKDTRPGEPPNSVAAWRQRTEKGEDWLGVFAKQTTAVLDYLIKNGYTDPGKVGIAGTSRGGFIACHLAAREPRFRAVIAFAPVTEPMVVTEFHGSTRPEALRAMNLAHIAGKLTDRSLWMCIGNNDARVGTDQAFAFARKVVAASPPGKKISDVTVVIVPTEGHSIHKTAHDEAALWLLERLKPAK